MIEPSGRENVHKYSTKSHMQEWTASEAATPFPSSRSSPGPRGQKPIRRAVGLPWVGASHKAGRAALHNSQAARGKQNEREMGRGQLEQGPRKSRLLDS